MDEVNGEEEQTPEEIGEVAPVAEVIGKEMTKDSSINNNRIIKITLMAEVSSPTEEVSTMTEEDVDIEEETEDNVIIKTAIITTRETFIMKGTIIITMIKRILFFLEIDCNKNLENSVNNNSVNFVNKNNQSNYSDYEKNRVNFR